MKLVEVIRGLATSDETYQQVFAFSHTLGKEPVTAPDRPGFIANRQSAGEPQGPVKEIPS